MDVLEIERSQENVAGLGIILLMFVALDLFVTLIAKCA